MSVGGDGTIDSVDTWDVLVLPITGFKDTIASGIRNIVSATDTIKGMFAECSSVGLARVASFHAEEIGTDEPKPM